MDGTREAEDAVSVTAAVPPGLSRDGHAWHGTVARAMAGASGRAVRPATPVDGARSIAYWRRDGGGDVDYVRPDHHTLSVYLEGGYGVRDRDLPDGRGSPGSICVLPAGHESRWFNDAPVGVLHVYFDDADLESLGRPLPPILRQTHFGDDRLLHALGRGLVEEVDWHGEAERLVVEQLVRSMLSRLLSHHDTRLHRAGEPDGSRTSGLSSRRLAAIDARLAVSGRAPVSLGELAAGAGLSVRQFARAYRAATGTTPGRRSTALRVRRAQGLIRQGMPLVDVAAETGFSSQSHLTRRFRELVGVTPARWRAREVE